MNKNIALARKLMPNSVEHKYQKALVDPSHPSVSGVRIPRLMAEETATYRDYSSTDINASQFIAVANMELACRDDFMTTTDPAICEAIINKPVTDIQVTIEGNGQNDGPVRAHAIMFNSPLDNFKGRWVIPTFDVDSHFSKVVKVASCIQLCKTSSAETESGVLDMMYG